MSEAMCAGCGRWSVFYETTQSCSTCQPGRASEMIDGLRARAEAAERERDRLRGAAAYHMRERKALAEQRDAALAELERRLDPGEYGVIYRQIATPRAALAGELDAAELCGSVLDRKGISRKRFRIWERINEYAEACGGDTSPTTVSDRRMRAVVAVESALDAALAGEGEAKECWCQWEVGDSPCPTHGMDEMKGGRNA